MTPRDRDGQRSSAGRYSDPAWDHFPADEALAGEDLPIDSYADEQPDWQDPGRPPANQSRSSARPRSSYPYDTNPEARKRQSSPLPELTRGLERNDEFGAVQRSNPARSTKQSAASAYDVPQESEDWLYESEWEPDAYASEDIEDDYAAAPPRRRSGASRARGRALAAPRAPSITVPPAIGAVISAQDRSVLGLFGVAAVGLLLMTLLVGSRIGNLPDVFPIHLDASGAPDLWGTQSTIWRVPLAAAMITLINTIVALYMSPRDPFVARFLVGSALLAQVIAWIALFLLLW